MQKNKIIGILLLMVLLLALMLGVSHLFVLRFNAGDVYPAYSSLRSDPLGTRAFYESLKNFDHISVSRNYDFRHSLKFEPQTTFLYLGAAADDCESLPRDFLDVFDRLAHSGGRLVFSLLPINKRLAKKSNRTCPTQKVKAEEKAGLQTDNDAQNPTQAGDIKSARTREESESENEKDPTFDKVTGKEKLISIKELWGVDVAFNEKVSTPDDSYLDLAATSHRLNLPSAISWHTNLYFELFDNTWQVVYSCEGYPVMVERSFGKGTIVLCADSFFFSNEAMWSERHPQLLVWLMGNPAKIVFDEAHLGICRNPSVAGLLRHYRFHWFFIALVAVALLFVWKSAVYFVPPREDSLSTGADVVSEKDYSQGLTALLRRNIAPQKILPVCGQVWIQTFKNDKHVQPDTIARMQAVLNAKRHSSPKQTDPISAYRSISRIISEDNRYE